jgi:hypothetical protein
MALLTMGYGLENFAFSCMYSYEISSSGKDDTNVHFSL